MHAVNLRARLVPSLLDRYVMAEVLPPTFLGLLVFTFILLLQQITLLTGLLIARGADLPTVLRLFFNLLPSILATTIPMAFLLGVLLAFGRLAADSELIAMRAGGISPTRLLRPLGALALAAATINFYVLAYAVPEANQAYREIFYNLVVSKARTGVKARVFVDDLIPGMVLYVSDIPADTGEWRDLLLHDNTVANKPRLILARQGRLVIDESQKRVELHLEAGQLHTYDQTKPGSYEFQRFKSGEFPLPFDEFFPKIPLQKGDREMTLTELLDQADRPPVKGQPHEPHKLWVEVHKKFAIPAACFVFAGLGLGLSLGARREARSAAFGLSIAIIFVYYVLIRLGEQAGDNKLIAPWIAMWGANVVLGAAAAGLLWLNLREPAFDPLSPGHYLAWLPRLFPARTTPAPVPAVARSGGARVRPPRQRPVASSGGTPAVVLRVPRLGVPVGSRLDRYIAREYFGYLLLVLTSFWAIYTLTEFMDLFDDVQQNRVKGMVVLHYYFFHAPFIVHLITPVAVLVTTLVTFGVMSRRNEITAMKAGGISVYRAAVPVIGMGLLASGFLFGLSEFVLPEANRVAHRDFNVIKGRPPQSGTTFDRRWILGADGRFYNYDYYVEGPERGQASLYGLAVYEVEPRQWQLADRFYARRASWNGSVYELTGGWRRTFLPQAAFREFEQARTARIDPPQYFRREDREPDTMGFGALSRYIDSLDSLGLDVTRLRVQLHRKLAFPSLGLVMTLIGIPYAFVVGRRGALHGVAISIVVAIVYWACLGVFEALGNNALLPPFLAAWAPNLIFGSVGVYLMLTLET
jgi:LPS export ABC transporter permease LptF/LPS export ABC transporter permease LptG